LAEPLSESWTDKELKKIGIDLYKEKIFTSAQIRPDDKGLVMSIFIPLSLLTKEKRKLMNSIEPAVYFEYIEKAEPRSINGYPAFLSLHCLNADEWKKVLRVRNELLEAEKRILISY
jgi:hypothetical protein